MSATTDVGLLYCERWPEHLTGLVLVYCRAQEIHVARTHAATV